MDNQDQYNEEEEYTSEVKTSQTFSAARRTFATILALVAGLLLAFIVYELFFAAQVQPESVEVSTEPAAAEGPSMDQESNLSLVEKQQVTAERAAEQTQEVLEYDSETDTYATVQSEKQVLSAEEKLAIIQQRQLSAQLDSVEPEIE